MVRGRRTRKAAGASTVTAAGGGGGVAAETGPQRSTVSLSPISSAAKHTHSPLTAQNGGVGATGATVKLVSGKAGNVVLVDDYCCASPKRKEYKIDELLIKNGQTVSQNGACCYGALNMETGTTTTTTTTTTIDIQSSPTKTRMILRGTQAVAAVAAVASVQPSNGCKDVTSNGRLCPMAGNEITRFLLTQSKSKSRKTRKKSPNFELVNDDTCDSFAHGQNNGTQQQQQLMSGVMKMEAEEEEGEYADEAGEDSENSQPNAGAGAVGGTFQMFGRMPIGNGMVAEENIFLQEPVLTLTVDEAACVLVQPKSRSGKQQQQSRQGKNKKAANGSGNGNGGELAAALINQDSNSGDSGVVVDKLQDAAASAGVAVGNNHSPLNSTAIVQTTPKPVINVSRSRIPTTPHRILCPSSPQVNGTANGGVGVKEEEGGMVVEECENGQEVSEEDDLQMTKRKLIMCPIEDANGETVALKNESGDAEKPSDPVKQEEFAEGAMKPPKTKAPTSNGHQSTMEDFFKVRRSVRKTKKEVEREEQLAIEKAILAACDVGLAVKMFDNKGRGIVATRPFARGEFVVEYVGEFISIAEANRREKLYAQDQNTGCYMYYFKHKNKQYCIDATEETGKLGRLVNHSRNGNLMTRTVEVKGQPHLVLIAKEDIEAGRELNYDYGDRSKESLLHHPWLAY